MEIQASRGINVFGVCDLHVMMMQRSLEDGELNMIAISVSEVDLVCEFLQGAKVEAIKLQNESQRQARRRNGIVT